MAQQQGLAFTSGVEAQERLGSPAEPATAHHSGGQDRPASGRAFEQLRRLSSTQLHQKAAAGGGVTSRQAIFPSQVQSEMQTIGNGCLSLYVMGAAKVALCGPL